MKKIIFCLAFFLFIPIVTAGSFSVSSSSTSVNVGSSVTIYVKANDAAGRFSVNSNNSGVLAFSDDSSSIWLDNNSSSFKFTAKSAGTAVITVVPSDCAGYDEKEITGSKSITINVNNPTNNTGGTSNNNNTNNNTNTNKKTTVNDKMKSSINYLSKLEVNGFELSPSFDKEVTEYSVTLPNGTNSITINGTKESDSSYVTGLGEINVSDGINEISVIVTAENGAKRTYNIKATVEEEEPIIVNIDGNDFTMIRKKENMPATSDYYVLNSITIDGNEIPCYTSETTKYTLVALKDNSGNIYLYKYDNNVYTKYVEFGFSTIKLSLLEPSSIIEGYVEDSITINEKEVKAYTKEGNLPLIYGINIETGETNYYSYDSSEGTIQKYTIPQEKNNKKYYPYIIIGLTCLNLLEFIIIICVISSKNKKLKKKLNDKLNTKTEFEESKKELGHTSIISSSVGTVFDEPKKKKDKKKKDDDDMYKF